MPDIGDSYLRNMTAFNKNYRKYCLNAVKAYHFTPGEVDVMTFLANNPQMNTAAAISQFKNISKPLVCKSVDSLIQKGYLTSETDSVDRRISRLYLTEKSTDIADTLRLCRQTFFAQLMAGITEEELRIFETVMGKMQINLANYTNNLEERRALNE